MPEEYGGLGENHVAYSMVCETIARYGCASTAMCYVMHIGAVNAIMLRATPELIDKYIRPLHSGKTRHPLVLGPRDGLPLLVPRLLRRRTRERRVQGAQEGVVDDVGRVRRLLRRPDDQPGLHRATTTCRCSWSTANTCKSQPSLWDALGLRGNQSGPLEIDDVEIPAAQLVGPTGDGATSNDESVDPWFLIGSSSVWNGLALGAIDIAKRHTTRKKHVDVGLRVADYPTIQDYVGEAVMDTNA